MLVCSAARTQPQLQGSSCATRTMCVHWMFSSSLAHQQHSTKCCPRPVPHTCNADTLQHCISVCTEFSSAAHRLLSSGHVRRLARKLAALRAQCDDVCAVVTAGGCYAEQARIFVIPLPAHARSFRYSLVLSVAWAQHPLWHACTPARDRQQLVLEERLLWALQKGPRHFRLDTKI